MPATGACCREKAVLVTIYVERPRRKTNHHHHRHHGHHDHYDHYRIKQRPIQNIHRGYDRRANLLRYSQNLRQSALPQQPSTPSHNPLLQSPSTSSNKPQQQRIIHVKGKRRNLASPTCLGDWKKLLLPSFLRSFLDHQTKREKKKKASESTTHKMKAIIKSLDKQWGLVSKLLSAFRRKR